MSEQHNPNLDILRAGAVLAVLVCHFTQVVGGASYGQRVVFGLDTDSLGRIGVLVFFVHTSLVLMQSMDRMQLNGRSLFFAFYIRRLFRIYPLSVLMVLIGVTLQIPPNALGTPYHWEGIRWLVANLALVQNIMHVESVSAPLWTLPWEVQMYLALPLIFLVLLRTRARLLASLLLYAAGLGVSGIHGFYFAPCFLAGVLAYVLLEKVHPIAPSWLWAPVVTLLIGGYTLVSASEMHFSAYVPCLIAGGLIPLFRPASGWAASIGAIIAKYSYGIYLCHTPLLWLFYQKLDEPSWLRFVAAALSIAAVSWLCFRFVEEPFIRLGKKLSAKVGPQSSSQSLAASA